LVARASAVLGTAHPYGVASFLIIIIFVFVVMMVVPVAVIIVTVPVSAVTIDRRAVILRWVISGRIVVSRRRGNVRRGRCDDYHARQADAETDRPVFGMCG
jgi:hypothetical protein